MRTAKNLIIVEFTLVNYMLKNTPVLSTCMHEEHGGGMTLPVVQQLQGVARENFAVVVFLKSSLENRTPLKHSGNHCT